MQLRTRSVMPSMVTNYSNADGSVTDRLINYFVEKAKNNVGLIILEAAYADKRGKGFVNQVGIDINRMMLDR